MQRINDLQLCLKFYKVFTNIEAEIICYLLQNGYTVGGYVDLADKLGRGRKNTGTAPNIRKASIKLWERGYLNLYNTNGIISRTAELPKRVCGFSLAENFVYRLDSENYVQPEELRLQKIKEDKIK